MVGTLGGNALPVDVVNDVTLQQQSGPASQMLIGSTKLWTYRNIRTGEVQGKVTSGNFPNIPGELIKIKAMPDNAGNVYIGWNAAVTVANGVTDTTTGYVLDADDETPYLPIANLNLLFYICDNAGDDMTYIVLVS